VEGALPASSSPAGAATGEGLEPVLAAVALFRNTLSCKQDSFREKCTANQEMTLSKKEGAKIICCFHEKKNRLKKCTKES
jgi:hypothetical protein